MASVDRSWLGTKSPGKQTALDLSIKILVDSIVPRMDENRGREEIAVDHGTDKFIAAAASHVNVQLP